MTLVTLILTLLACPTASPEGSGDACPTDVELGDADMGCDCHGSTLEALPGCGEYYCGDEGFAHDDGECETGGCKGVDCG